MIIFTPDFQIQELTADGPSKLNFEPHTSQGDDEEAGQFHIEELFCSYYSIILDEVLSTLLRVQMWSWNCVSDDSKAANVSYRCQRQ